MLRVFLAFFMTMAASVGAFAGPWARDPSGVFVSYTLNADTTQDAIADGSFETSLFHSLYGEVGVGRRITLVFDLGRDTDSSLGSAFGRYTFTRNAATWQVAAELGFGWIETDTVDQTDLYRVGLSFGRGFQQRHLEWVPFFEPESAWFTVDSNVQIDPDGAQTLWESEATFGLFVNDRFGGLFQVKAEEYPGADLAVYVSPAVLMRLGDQTTAQLGGRFAIEGSEEVGLRFALWQEF